MTSRSCSRSMHMIRDILLSERPAVCGVRPSAMAPEVAQGGEKQAGAVRRPRCAGRDRQDPNSDGTAGFGSQRHGPAANEPGGVADVAGTGLGTAHSNFLVK